MKAPGAVKLFIDQTLLLELPHGLLRPAQAEKARYLRCVQRAPQVVGAAAQKHLSSLC